MSRLDIIARSEAYADKIIDELQGEVPTWVRLSIEAAFLAGYQAGSNDELELQAQFRLLQTPVGGHA